MAASPLLLRRLLLAATGGVSLLTACGGSTDDTAPGSTTAGGSGGGAGSSQAGSSQAGSSQAGSSQAGSSQAGSSQAGSSQAGSSQAGAAGTTMQGGAAGSMMKAGAAGTTTQGGAAGTSQAGAGGGAGSSQAGAGGACAGTCVVGQKKCSNATHPDVCGIDESGCPGWLLAAECMNDEVCSGGTCVKKTPGGCLPEVACVGGEWCTAGAPDAQDDICTCPITNAPEKLLCGQSYPWGMTVPVCYDPKGAPCLALGSPDLYTTLGARWQLNCSFPMTGPNMANTSAGEPRCCYDVSVTGCVGRPLVAADGLRVADVVRSDAWS